MGVCLFFDKTNDQIEPNRDRDAVFIIANQGLTMVSWTTYHFRLFVGLSLSPSIYLQCVVGIHQCRGSTDSISDSKLAKSLCSAKSATAC